jgi:hypothetical protein
MSRVVLSWFFVFAFGVAPAGARPPAGLDAFLAACQCQVFHILEIIHAHATTPHQRFLVLSLDGDQRYVQCLLLDNDTRMLCEASSGFYGPPPRLGLSKRALASIAAQDFSMDGSHGNFQRALPIGERPDMWNAAGVMLETLYGGYGARLGREIRMNAPFAPGDALQPTDGSCRPSVS